MWGRRCDANPTQICELQRVPAGRCSRGAIQAIDCVWPAGAGFCVNNERVACLPDNPAQAALTTGTFFSTMCSGITGPGLCNVGSNAGTLSTHRNNPACGCQDTDPTDPLTGTFAVCGGTFPVCSDGDPHAIDGGHGVGLCVELTLFGQTSRTNCGHNADTSAVTGPTYPIENPIENNTLQRNPGTTGAGPIRPARATFALEYFGTDSFGVRRYVTHGSSYHADVTFNDKTTTGALISSHIVVFSCPVYSGWTTQLPVLGVCSNAPDDACNVNGDCPGGTCINREYCHQVATDGRGFIFTDTFDPTDPAVVASGTCPPDCGLNYDWSTTELQAVVDAGLEDSDAGVQLAMNHVTGGQAGPRDLLTVGVNTSGTALGDEQIRCFLGGDPAAPAGHIGRCLNSTLPCNPAITPTPCPGGTACLYCGGTHTSADPINGNADALPVGYQDFGLSDLSLTAPAGDASSPRIHALNSVPFLVVVPLYVVGTTGHAGASVRDDPGEGDLATLGPTSVAGLSTGIGVGGTFTNGTNFPIGTAGLAATCCEKGNDIVWNPLDEGTFQAVANVVYTDFLRAPDRGPGDDGIPGCFGDNPPNNNSVDACDGVNSKVAGTTGNTGADDVRLSILIDSGTPQHAARSRFKVSGPHPLVEAAYPGADLHTSNIVGLNAARDLDVIDADNADVIFKTNLTSCPIVDGVAVCCRDDDGDGHCHDVDPCPVFPNGAITPGVIPGACLCGDSNANGVHEFADAFTIIGCANLTGNPAFCSANANRLDTNGNGVAEFADAFAVIGQANLTAVARPYQLRCPARPDGVPPVGFAP